jgi:hypothetical protein
MDEDNGKISREAMARADKGSEIVIFWDLVFKVVVDVIGMLKRVFA